MIENQINQNPINQPVPFYKKIRIIHWIILIIIFLIILVVFGVMKISNRIVVSPTPKPEPTVSVTNWNTYTNREYGFKIEYPPNFYILENSSNLSNSFVPQYSLVKISSSEQFENAETALVIYIDTYEMDPGRPPWASQPDANIQAILNSNLDYQSLKAKHNSNIAGDFFGDPPWGYYRIFLPLESVSSAIKIWIRIHTSDDPVNSGTGEMIQAAKQILSTFQSFPPEK